MATVNSAIALDIINSSGYFQDDSRVIAVCAYNNMFDGSASYSILYSTGELNHFLEAVITMPGTTPIILWTVAEGLTPNGRAFVAGDDPTTGVICP